MVSDRQVLLSWPDLLGAESGDSGVCLGAQDSPGDRLSASMGDFNRTMG